MHVQAIFEGTQQGFVTRQMGHDAQLDLRIVGTGNQLALWGHKGFAHAAAFGRAHGNVLQIGVVAGQAPRHRHGLRVVGVHTAIRWQGHLRQLVGVGALELGQRAVLEQLGGQRIVLGQLLQHFLVRAARAGGGLLDHRHAQLVEEDLSQLLGRGQIEGLARDLVSLLL